MVVVLVLLPAPVELAPELPAPVDEVLDMSLDGLEEVLDGVDVVVVDVADVSLDE